MYNHIVFIGYLVASIVGVIDLLLVVFLSIRIQTNQMAFYKESRCFVLNILAVSALYFLFFYMEFTSGIVEIPVAGRIADSFVCTVLPYTWIRLIGAMADNQRILKLKRAAFGITVLSLLLYIFICIFFMDGLYYIASPMLQRYFPYCCGMFSLLQASFILIAAVQSIRWNISSLQKKYIWFCSVCLVFLIVNHLIIGVGLYRGNLGESGWAMNLSDPTGPIGALVCFATIVLIYCSDLSHVFRVQEEEGHSGEEPVSNLLDQAAKVYGLTPREREVIACVYDGMTNPEIAAQLFISKNTVKLHVGHIFEKLGVSSRIELIHLINVQFRGNSTLG